jgi:hypothetical protein
VFFCSTQIERSRNLSEIAWFRKASRPISLLGFPRYGITSCLLVIKEKIMTSGASSLEVRGADVTVMAAGGA